MNQEAPEDAISEKFDMSLWTKIFRLALRYKRLLIPLAISAVAIAGGGCQLCAGDSLGGG
jgi:ATP-binding cassette subfamily B protein